jgi:hypothetical protein
MAGLRTATATNINLFEGGDSNITSATLLGAMQEITEVLDLGIAAYNADNTLLPYPDIDITYNAGVCSATIPVPMDKVAGEWVALNYLNAYIPWVVPTTGELTGIANALEAYLYILEAVGDANDLLRPGSIIQSAKGTTTDALDKIAKVNNTTFTLPFDTVVDAVTGAVSKVFQNFHVITDLQQGYPIV